MYEDLKDKVALVTGSSSGIGEATVYLLSKCGAKVVVTGRDAQKVEEVAKKCQEVSPSKYKPVTFVGDLEKEEDVENLYQTTVRQYGGLDILINNAGATKFLSIMDEDFMKEFDSVMNLHCRSVVQLSRLAIPFLIQNKGCIINVSSIASTRQHPQLCHYGMSKAALDKLTKQLALQFGPRGVRVNSVNPGVVKTNVHYRAGLGDEEYEYAAKEYPLRRYGKAEEVAELIAFLASEKSAFMTGTTIPIDGGALCKS